MYEFTPNTVKVLSSALYELAGKKLTGAEALRELASLIRTHAELYGIVEPETEPDTVQAVSDARTTIAPEIVFVLGGPGSGKGTISPLLVKDFGFKHLSVGHLLRTEVTTGSELGIQADLIMRSGGLVPDEVALRLAKQEISRIVEINPAARILLDGFPRTLDQAKAFESLIYPAANVIWLTCGEEILLARILERAKTSGRADDTAESVLLRLRTFNENTELIKKYYEEQTPPKISVIDASLPVEAVYAQVKSLFM
jgi:adenylate kinase family enzyme